MTTESPPPAPAAEVLTDEEAHAAIYGERARAPDDVAALIAQLLAIDYTAPHDDLCHEAAAALGQMQRRIAEQTELLELREGEIGSLALHISDLQSALAAARRDAERRLHLLRRLERWANDRIGESWKIHDAVNPVLFEQVLHEFANSGGALAIDAALSAAPTTAAMPTAVCPRCQHGVKHKAGDDVPHAVEMCDDIYAERTEEVLGLVEALDAINTLCGGHDEQSRQVQKIVADAIREHARWTQ